MDQGKIVEQGSHATLLEGDGIYAKLHGMQFRDAGDRAISTSSKPRIIRSSVLNKALMQNWISQSTQRRQGWWLWSMNPFSIFLMPISLIYYVTASLRRLSYRLGILKSHKLPVTTIVVGNITLGGNGKTPIVIALYQLLQSNGYQVGIITRGYKSGHEQRTQLLSNGLISAAVGDEANMMSEICRCPIGVGANRVKAATQILQQFPDINVILSDDGLQHYALERDIEIAVCRFMALGNGLMLPAGPLREPRSRLDQVDITINRDSNQVVESLGEVWNLVDPETKRNISDFHGEQVHALAGIGFPEIFFASLAQMGIDVIEHEYPDHFEFSARELNLKPDLPILVTHKDAVKLKGIARDNVWVVPLQIELGDALKEQILGLLESHRHG
jgi:tetraacyldisaccharide 4'-kinase